MLHERFEPLDDLVPLVEAELRLASRVLAKRLGWSKPLVVFADHGFRIARDGQSYTHGGSCSSAPSRRSSWGRNASRARGAQHAWRGTMRVDASRPGWRCWGGATRRQVRGSWGPHQTELGEGLQQSRDGADRVRAKDTQEGDSKPDRGRTLFQGERGRGRLQLSSWEFFFHFGNRRSSPVLRQGSGCFRPRVARLTEVLAAM